MVDIVTPDKRSEMMAGIGSKNTKPELVVRQLLHQMGYRFRLHRQDLPGRPDIALPKWKTVVLVHGCFWHGHGSCPLFRLPKSRTQFWEEKIAANCRRDEQVRSDLNNLAWRVIEIWECASKGRTAMPVMDLGIELDKAIRIDRAMRLEIRGAQIA